MAGALQKCETSRRSSTSSLCLAAPLGWWCLTYVPGDVGRLRWCRPTPSRYVITVRAWQGGPFLHRFAARIRVTSRSNRPLVPLSALSQGLAITNGSLVCKVRELSSIAIHLESRLHQSTRNVDTYLRTHEGCLAAGQLMSALPLKIWIRIT